MNLGGGEAGILVNTNVSIFHIFVVMLHFKMANDEPRNEMC